jgi:hypothetical protein
MDTAPSSLLQISVNYQALIVAGLNLLCYVYHNTNPTVVTNIDSANWNEAAL